MTYFSERDQGLRPRTEEEIDARAWGGFSALIQARIDDGSFGYRYPDVCHNGPAVIGTNETSFLRALCAEIPSLLDWPLGQEEPPSTLEILDMLEFCWGAVAEPIQRGYHDYFQHHHIAFDAEEGRASFREDVNRILRRNGLAYDLGEEGKIERLAPVGLREALERAVFHTGDGELDEMLEVARKKFLDPDDNVRREALEKLWDAWERLKTLEPGANKRESTQALLNRVASGPRFREALEREAYELREIGNSFQIRHSETTQEPLTQAEQVDYLFHRLFAMLRLLLRSTSRGG